MKVDRLPDHPEYQNRDARVKILDKQNLETVFMLPTFACGVEEALKHDIEATMATVHAFNLWLDEDWGFDRPDHRFLSAPIISLADPDKAVEEVEFVLEPRRQDRVRAARAGARGGQAALAGRSAARSGVGPAGRGRRSGGLPPVRQRLSRDRGAVGRQGHVRGVRQEGPARPGPARRPGDPRRDGVDDRAPGVHPPSEAQGRQHRERFVLRVPLDQAAEEGRQHRAVPLQGRPGRAAAEQRLDRAVLRGRRAGCSPRPSASTRSCSARTGRTARGSRIR